MLTKNYRRMIMTIFRSTSDYLTFVATDGQQYGSNGYFTYASCQKIMYTQVSNQSLANLGDNCSTIMFGTSTQAVSSDDYSLISPADDTLFSRQTTNKNIPVGAENRETVEQTVQYNGTDEIEVSEVGWVCKQSGHYVLLAREVIEPIKIHNGDTFQVSMIIG